jgi:alkanesulfonate monooxygenase SsuD/methylene tetrahydromethanopterin reductase-like flavin-dependent oxidoreductase (luciferase family)
MEFGMFHEFPVVPGHPDEEAFAQGMAQVDAAERWGLDAMWLAELHFVPKRSVLSFPLGIAAAIAARTERMKIGIAVQVLPLAHPLRIAEEAATVDQLSRGRLIFGAGRSGLPRTYESYGIAYAESRERFAEALEIIKLAWTQPSVSYDGKYHRIQDVAATPKPYQTPMPDIRIAATSPDTFVTNGKLGHPIFVAVRTETFSDLVPEIRSYREAFAAAGHPGKPAVYLRVPAYVAESDARAEDEAAPSMLKLFRGHAQLIKDAATKTNEPAAIERAKHADRLMTLTYQETLGAQVLSGSPASVTAQLRAIQDELGLDGILAELNCGGTIPHDNVMTALRLLCQDVMPNFH